VLALFLFALHFLGLLFKYVQYLPSSFVFFAYPRSRPQTIGEADANALALASLTFRASLSYKLTFALRPAA